MSLELQTFGTHVTPGSAVALAEHSPTVLGFPASQAAARLRKHVTAQLISDRTPFDFLFPSYVVDHRATNLEILSNNLVAAKNKLPINVMDYDAMAISSLGAVRIAKHSRQRLLYEELVERDDLRITPDLFDRSQGVKQVTINLDSAHRLALGDIGIDIGRTPGSTMALASEFLAQILHLNPVWSKVYDADMRRRDNMVTSQVAN